MDVHAWIEAYGRAWRDGDDAAAADLFTEDGLYRSHPFREPHRGREAIRAYWRSATSAQQDLAVRFGEPIVAGNRAAVEWWATIREDGEEVTLPGILVLRFDAAGRCEELREAWHYEPGRREPPEGWGR
jgi:uncharacterized protein (TIGR02246 family)